MLTLTSPAGQVLISVCGAAGMLLFALLQPEYLLLLLPLMVLTLGALAMYQFPQAIVALLVLTYGIGLDIQLDGGMSVVDQVKRDPASAPISDKLRALLAIAGRVQQSGRLVTAEDVEAARAQGATDVEIHDTVLIAAAFSMFNRYVDGLATFTPTDPALYDEMAVEIVANGYVRR